MNLLQLKYFHAVCTYGTVSAASEYLHISQPSVSSAIKELEREFQITLFIRRHQGMELTSAGETLLKISRDLLNQSQQLENVMRDLGNERKKLRLGVPPMIGSLLLPKIFSEFMAENEEVELEIVESGRKELVKKLTDEVVDMVFLPHDRPLDSNFSSLKIGELEIVCCTSLKDAKIKYKKVSPNDLRDVPVVLFKNSFFQTEEIKKWFMRENINPNIILQTEQLSTVLSLITNNIAIGFMFRSLVELNHNLIAIPTENPIVVNVSLVWKRDAYFFNSMKKLKKFASERESLI